MYSSRPKGILRLPAFCVLGIVDGVQFLDLAFGIIRDDDLDGPQHGQPAQGALVQVLADGVFQHGNVRDAVVFGDADVVGKVAQSFRRYAAPADAAEMVGMRGSSQPETSFSFTSCMSLRLLMTV